MSISSRLRLLSSVAALFTAVAATLSNLPFALAQAATKPAAKSDAPVNPASLIKKDPYKKLAPGVMQEVDPTRKTEETGERHDITELMYIDPNFDFAKDATVRHDIWMLQFKYKPVRMLWADIPGPNLKMQRKQIWYMVYEVTNTGKVYHPVMASDQTYKLDTVDKPLQFVPMCSLEVHSRLQNEVAASGKVYYEKYIPIVLPAIRAREDKNREFISDFDMPSKIIPVGQSLWGVATWQDIDPQNVWFSVNVEGLTNATTYKDDMAKYAAKASGAGREPYREIFTKVLKLNFWRPGDEYTVKESQIRLGTPSLTPDNPGLPSYEWVWHRAYPADK
jgi:hypothetical protein